MNAISKEAVLKGATLALAATGSLALTWGATPAIAQGKAGFAPMGDPFNSFSIGIGGGVDIFRTHADSYACDYNCVGYGGPLSATGGFGSVEIGKDFRFGSLVLGIAGEYNFGSKSDSVSGSNCYYSSCTDSTTTLKLGNSYAAIARLGMLVAPQTLVYGLFGYTWQQYTAAVTLDDEYYSHHWSWSHSGTTGGLTFGIGGEWLINQMMSVKAEYRLVRLDPPASVGDCCAGAVAHFDKVDDHVFRGILSIKLPGL